MTDLERVRRAMPQGRIPEQKVLIGDIERGLRHEFPDAWDGGSRDLAPLNPIPAGAVFWPTDAGPSFHIIIRDLTVVGVEQRDVAGDFLD
jgi:hypothetical protein